MPTDPSLSRLPVQYRCLSCQLILMSWIPHLDYVEMFYKAAPWVDFWTGDVRLICQYCLGATVILPPRLVDVLRRKYGIYAPKPVPPHEPTRED